MNEKRLTFGEFVDEVRRNIKDYLPQKFADAEVHVDQFQKLNTAYLGMQVKREDQMVVPNINFNGMFAQYPAPLETIAQQMETDFFVLPSSVHEVLILPDDGSQDLESLQFMVREINRTEVAPEAVSAADHVRCKAEAGNCGKRVKQERGRADARLPVGYRSSNRSSNSSGEYRVTPKPRKSFLFLVTIPSHLFDLAQVAIRQSSKSFAFT